jgi:hypothetical protein
MSTDQEVNEATHWLIGHATSGSHEAKLLAGIIYVLMNDNTRLEKLEKICKTTVTQHLEMPDDCKTWSPCSCKICVFFRDNHNPNPYKR